MNNRESILPVAALLVVGLAVMSAGGGEFAANGCRVEWSERSLSVGNGLFSKTYVSVGGILRTASFKDASGSEWQTEKFSAADEISVAAAGAKWSPAGADGVRVEVVTPSSTNVVWTFPGMPGVISEIQAGEKVAPAHDLDRDVDKFAEWRESLRAVADGGDRIAYGLRHVKATSCVCADQTDIRDSLLHVEERLLMNYDAPFTAAATSLDCRDVLTGEGIVFVRIAPMPVSRPNKDDDFIIDGGTRTVSPVANGYPLAELVYRGGEAGRQRAVVAFQRALRPFRPGRDGVLLSNTWGAGNRDSRICQEFLLKEIDAGARIGVDVIQIDDGWQRGRTANSKKKEISGSKKVWNGYWAADPLFWTEDRERFPDGLDFLVRRAKEKGMRFGLWFGPDSSGEAANWERDADWLLGMHRTLGIDYYKMDSMKLRSPLALKRNRAMFDKMLRESGGAMVFDLDCTAEVRPGFFGLIDIGPLFVENRYTRRPIYWPHHTLKNLWDLAHMIDPVRLRFEFNNPDTNHENYGWSPLGHGNYRPDTLFATVMAASPLAWMELSDVSEKSADEIASLVKVWKRERDRWYGGTMHPVGARPDGVAWTGFVSEAADGAGGYALLFRELNDSADFALDLSGVFGSGFEADAEVIAGRGAAKFSGGRLSVSIPKKLDYLWVRLSSPRSGVPMPEDVPELMTTFDGEKVTSVEQWEKKRVPELLEEFTKEEYGRRPVERPEILSFEAEEPDAVMMDGRAIRKRVRVTYGGEHGKGSFVFTAFIPRQDRPAPAFLLICNRSPAENIDPTREKKSDFWPAEEIVARGYAAIAFWNGDIAPDWNTGNTRGVFAVFSEVERPYRPTDEWGTISAWAWGASRVMDWIETEPLIDAGHVAVVGHSRGGKTALVAGVYDRRFAMACSNDSGCSGAKLNHIDLPKSEHVDVITSVFPYWFCRNYTRHANAEKAWRVDQHEFIALMAPRLVCIGSASEDAWAGQEGEFHSGLLASPAWELYGRKGLVASKFPSPESPLQEGCISYHLRTGKHNLTSYDWGVYMDFADRHGWRAVRF